MKVAITDNVEHYLIVGSSGYAWTTVDFFLEPRCSNTRWWCKLVITRSTKYSRSNGMPILWSLSWAAVWWILPCVCLAHHCLLHHCLFHVLNYREITLYCSSGGLVRVASASEVTKLQLKLSSTRLFSCFGDHVNLKLIIWHQTNQRQAIPYREVLYQDETDSLQWDFWCLVNELQIKTTWKAWSRKI